MNHALVFATSLIDAQPQRYQDWINYYSDFFGSQVDMLMINDGPNDHIINFREVMQVVLPTHLGRKGIWKFPGWKRSFYYGLRYAKDQGYKYIAHIESDCGITSRGKEEFLKNLHSPGYYTGWCRTYGFPETSLQILNEPWVLNYFLDRYSCEENWYEDISFENNVKHHLNPTYMLNGDRYEYKPERFNVEYTYLSGCDLRSFLQLFNGAA